MSFSTHSQYVVNHPFRWQGRDRKRGEPFDVRMNPRQAKLLFEKRDIVPAGDYRGPLAEGGFLESALTDVNEGGQEAFVPDADDVREEDLEEVLREELAEPVASLTVHAKGGGWFDVVDADGNPVNDKALRKDEAEALAAGK